MKKQNIMVMFGGNSCEHDISVITAMQLIKNISNKYKVLPVYVNKKNQMMLNKKCVDINFFKRMRKSKANIYLENGYIIRKNCFNKKIKIHCAILCFHGRNGEDGTVQGLLELNNIPYSSSGVLGSALTLNKCFSKQLLEQNNISVAKYVKATKTEQNIAYDMMKKKKINFPVIVKPNCLGSSIGVKKVKTKKELISALEVAFNFDDVALIEECVVPLFELNCACFRFKDKLIVSEIEQPLGKDEILSFADKYKKGNTKSAKGMKSLSRICPAKISDELKEQIKQLTKQVYSALDCSGVARVDFLVNTKTNQVYVNELNSIPGSFAFYLYDVLGISYTQLLDMIIENAVYEFENKNSLQNSIDNCVF